MNRFLLALTLGAVFFASQVTRAATYDNVYWVGGSGEWTGDAGAAIPYSTGHWSTNPNAATGLPAKVVLGRNDGIRVGQTVGSGTYDHDRVACTTGLNPCTGTITGGTQQGTDLYISGPVTVNYNPNRQILPDDPRTPPANTDRFGDWRFHPGNNTTPGTPTLNLSGGAVFEHITDNGGDSDGMWTRWNGAEMNLDGAGTEFRRGANTANGFTGGAFMFASYHGFANSVQTISISNGAKFTNSGQVWYGISGFDVGEENQPGIRVVTNINGGHMDFTGGDEYGLDNDGLPLRADLSFIYDWKHDADPTNDETFIVNFTGPGTITVDGDAALSLDGDTSTGGGGIRVATMTNTGVLSTRSGHTTHFVGSYGTDGTTQRSYQDLWNLGILTAQPNLSLPAKSGLTGDNFATYFSVTNTPGSTDYQLTSLLAAPPANGKSKGDYNNDGSVDAADYVMYRATLGSTTDLRADGDGSLHISAADLIHWRDNFGTTGLPTFGSGLGSAVPEPGAAFLVIFGLVSLCSFRRR